ncbi:MAG: CPBP family intramembrane glutamic endopeptidase [Candidatus Omnitrophota bacterium]
MFDLIKREKLYIFLLIFVILVNILIFLHKDKNIEKEHSVSIKDLNEIELKEENLKEFLSLNTLQAIFFRYFVFLGLLFFSSGVVSNISFIFKKKAIRLSSLLAKDAIRWNILDIVRVVISVVSISYVVLFIELSIIKGLHLDIGANLRMMLDTFFIDMIVLIVVVYFVVFKYKDNISSLGIRYSDLSKDILTGIKGYIFIIPSLALVLFFSLYIMDLVGYSPKDQAVFEIFMQEERTKLLIFFTFFIGILGPFVEEIFFRGFMYTALKKKIGTIWGALLTAGVFSLLHTNLAGFLPILLLGMLLVYLYEKTGSLIPSITVHIVHNTAVLILMFFMKSMKA